MERVTMPQLGETVTEGTVVRWLKAVGDPVAADEALYEVSTDKVDTEVPAPSGGFVRSLLADEGDTVPIGAVVALIGTSVDEPIPDDVGPDAPVPTVATASAGGGRATAPTAPSRRRADPSGSTTGPALTPVVRRLLDEHGLDERDVVGTGRDGRISRADVLATAANRPAVRASGNGHPDTGATAGPVVPVPRGDDEVVPFSRARHATAVAMRRSLVTSAHALVTTRVDYAAVEPVRRATGLSYLPFAARAATDALVAFPHLNASVGDDCLIVHRQVHLGIAVDLADEALVVPVVHDAGSRRLRALAADIADLAERARARRLRVEDLEGATFTITNVGAQGTVISAPIIDQPQVAILSTDGVRHEPVAKVGPDGTWSVTVHPVGNLSLSFDHRAVDGAYAARFLAHVRDLLEARDWSAEVGG